jgi:hypothetical protein
MRTRIAFPMQSSAIWFYFEEYGGGTKWLQPMRFGEERWLAAHKIFLMSTAFACLASKTIF